jgi:hypothetical protein
LVHENIGENARHTGNRDAADVDCALQGIELFIHEPPESTQLDCQAHHIANGRRQLLLPLATIILSGLEPSSLVHHRAV